MSDEEKKAIKILEINPEIIADLDEEMFEKMCEFKEKSIKELKYWASQIALNLIEKQSKEIEELKEDRKSYAEEYIHNNPWLYKQLNEVYILRKESEQKERKAYIKGTNDTHDLCNKMWKDKIKARIEELEDMYNELPKNPKEHLHSKTEYKIVIGELQSLLEKE